MSIDGVTLGCGMRSFVCSGMLGGVPLILRAERMEVVWGSEGRCIEGEGVEPGAALAEPGLTFSHGSPTPPAFSRQE